jgi:hypothetical protein
MRGAGELVLYLDFDGVLHHENVLWHPKIGPYLSAPEQYKLFMHVDLLRELLEPFPELFIVLSTSWSVRYGCTNAAKNLHPSLRVRVIGGTHHKRMDQRNFFNQSRGEQIWSDVCRRQPKAWLAIDDDVAHWPKHCLDRLVQTHPHDGISDPTVLTELKSKLHELCTQKT